MAYPNQGPYHNGYTQQYHGAPSYTGYVDPRQMNRPPVNGYPPYNNNAYASNGQIDPRSVQAAPPNAGYQQQYAPPPQQYRPPHPQQQQAYAVAIPAPLRAPAQNSNNGYVPKPTIQEQPPPAPPLDYQLLLLSMAEEYFAAAYGRGSIADMVRREIEMKEYYKLIATGLGCLEALLRNYKLAPEREAKVRLRYATVLYEETENAMEAEEALSKGISICDRHRFLDLKYNMQHLLARVMFQKNSKAAFKFLDSATTDAQAYQHVAWVYAFRFLRVSLHLELNSHQDLTAALGQLRSLIQLANEHREMAILATATTMEALICLKDSGDSEGFEQAQRALASVRSLQLDPAIRNMTQLTALTSFVDISCHLQRFDPVQALLSAQDMQSALANIDDGPSWDKNGSFAVPISNLNMPQSKNENGVIKRKSDGSLVLMLNWMPNDDIYNVGFLLNGIALAHKNTVDNQKAEKMFSEGINRTEPAQKASTKVPKSILIATKQQSWRECMAYYMRTYLAFALCARTSWPAAKEQVLQLKKLHNCWPDVPNDLSGLNQYLQATIAQGTGELSSAFDIYQSITNPTNTTTKTPNPQKHLHLLPYLFRELHLLSTLNTLLLTTSPHHHHSLHPNTPATLLSTIAPACTTSPNRNLTSAYHLLSAILPDPSSSKYLATKMSLQNALSAAKATQNNQLMCIVLNILTARFFSGVVGEQAEKSARSSCQLARKCRDSLWGFVAQGLLAETLEAAGREGEAGVAWAEMERVGGELPEGVRRWIAEGQGQGRGQGDTVMSGG